MLFDGLKIFKATKNDVKVAKLEVEKEKLKQQNAQIERATISTSNTGAYVKANFEIYIERVETLLTETKNLISKFKTMEENKLKWKERVEASGYKNQARENLEYLYLAKEFFSLADKAVSGITLTKNQNTFVYKFLPFFDGRKVLEEGYVEEDHSVLGEVVEVFKDFASDLISIKQKKTFNFDDMLSAYSGQIDKFIIPDFGLVFKKIRKDVSANTSVTNQSETKTKTCSKCSSVVPVGSKFCPACGSIIEAEKPNFCVCCGEKLVTGAKFCAKCGTKVE